MSGRASFDGRLHYSRKDPKYNELVMIIRILKEGLEEIASNDSSQVELAIDTLQLMEDTCRSSEIEDIRILPKLLNT